jgi:hypothetical protein
MPRRTKPRVITATNSTHVLSVGPLRTPIGTFTLEQLESARELVAQSQDKAEKSGDELTLKRLRADLTQLDAELERREFSAA